MVCPQQRSGETRFWNERIRPLPENVRLYRSVSAALAESSWDWVLAHNLHDLLDSRQLSIPKIFLVHGTLKGRIVQERSLIDRTQYLETLKIVLDQHRCRVIYISELKREDWGIPGDVLYSSVDPCDYGGYRGERRGILQVCNHFKERGEILGWEAHETACRDLPSLVLGNNPTLRESRVPTSWEDLKEHYRSFRIYLHTAVYPYEDGHNLALLEAMATGMPVAALRHPTSPVEDGVEGVVARNPVELREKVRWLLDQPEQAARMGNAARMTVARKFPLARFQAEWGSVASSLGFAQE